MDQINTRILLDEPNLQNHCFWLRNAKFQKTKIFLTVEWGEAVRPCIHRWLDIPVSILWPSTLKFSFFVPKSEQLKKQEDADDLNHNFKVIQKNLPIKKDGFASYLKQTTQEIADQIAKNLVDRALELDRKKLVKKLSKVNADDFKLQSFKSEMLDNFVEVAVNRYICEN